MRVIVCGGRNYHDKAHMFSVLDGLDEQEKIDCVIDGAALGADAIAHQWALERNKAWERHPAEWGRHGKKAGPIRNALMLTRRPDMVIAFPGGRGTQDMIEQAQGRGVPVFRIYP